MMRSAPFARARIMLAGIMAALAITPAQGGVAAQKDALAALGPYVSRGKGCGGHQASKRCVAHDKRDARKTRNRKRNRR